MTDVVETGILVDKTRFPIVLVWFGRTYSEEEWVASLKIIDELAAGSTPFVVLNVTRPDMETPTARHRKAVADWNSAYVTSGRQTILGWGSVIQSHALRGVLTAISWLTKFPYEQKVVAHLDQGIEWAEKLLNGSKNSVA